MDLFLMVGSRMKHPMAWLIVTIFYLNFFAGFWVHNCFIITTAFIGIISSTLFFPEAKHEVEWANRLMDSSLKEWMALNLRMKAGALIIIFSALGLLLIGLWYHWVLLIVFCAAVITIIKSSFLLGLLTKAQEKIEHSDTD